MLYEPLESVTVIFALGRSRITVSFTPEVIAGPLPAVPGKRGTGSTPPHIAGYWPAAVYGAVGAGSPFAWLPIGCPLFQFGIEPQSPLESFHQTAGTIKSFTFSISPWATSPSTVVSTVLNPGIDCT